MAKVKNFEEALLAYLDRMTVALETLAQVQSATVSPTDEWAFEGDEDVPGVISSKDYPPEKQPDE